MLPVAHGLAAWRSLSAVDAADCDKGLQRTFYGQLVVMRGQHHLKEVSLGHGRLVPWSVDTWAE